MSTPWARTAAEVAAEHGTDLATGLVAREAAARLARGGPNELQAAGATPAWRRLLEQFRDPLVYLLLAAVAISFGAWLLEGAQGPPFEVIVILVIVVANAVLGFWQEARAEEAVAALQRLAASRATVVRDGRQQRIPAADLVPGDVMLLAEGDEVSADGRLVDAAALFVAEAALTGESEPVLKDTAPVAPDAALGDRVCMVFSGTAVTRGRGVAVVTGTAMDTEIGTIARLLDETESDQTPLQREIDHVGRLLGRAVIAIALVVVAAILATSDITAPGDLVEVLLVGVSLAVAAVPEGLPAVLSVVLALGVQRMAQRRAIVTHLSSVETLGSASAICSDKTGTLTRNEMTIRRVVTPSGSVVVTGAGYEPAGTVLVGDRPIDDAALLDEVRMVVAGGCLANDAVLVDDGGTWAVQGDPTEGAFLVAEAKLPGLADVRRRRFRRVDELPFTSERKLMTTLEADADRQGRLDVVTKGAPDVLLARCTRVRVGRQVVPLDDDRRREVLTTVDRLAAGALRTLAVAGRLLDTDAAATPADPGLEHDLVWLGMVGILDPPRDEAREAIAQAAGAGVRTIMITGDHPRTAARIAADLGIVDGDPATLTGPELEAMDDGQLRRRVEDVSVYARVAPEHKLRIVDALQRGGRIVAMTGDGVNDAPALKAADIGVAMGITGTDVSKGAADMILADDNFATIVAAIGEGRGIFANIRRFLRFLLSSNIGEVLTMLLGVVLAGVIGLDGRGGAVAVPLLATQILWVNLLTDAAPALALGLDPPPDDVMRERPRGLHDRVIDGRMWIGIGWVGLVTGVVTLLALDVRLPGGLVDGTGDIVEARTMAFTTLVLAQLWNVFSARSDVTSAFHRLLTNGWLWGAVTVSVVLQVAVVHVPVLNRAFGTAPLSPVDWLVCLGLATCVLLATEAKKLVLRAIA